ncbi:MAG: hypothetical protein ACOY45_05160 [Pseudomonadota bacterium]
MAKKSKKQKKAGMLPKRIAGVKIPRPLRRQGYHLAALARHPLVADLVAAGAVALVNAMRDQTKPAEPVPPVEKPKPAPKAAAPGKRAPRKSAATTH